MVEHTSARERGNRMLHESGYKTGGEVTMPKVKRVVKRAVKEHETQEHEGKHAKLRLKSGGRVKGEHVKDRPDRQRRADGGGIVEGRSRERDDHETNEPKARGGKVGKHAGKVVVNVVGGQGGNPMEAQMAHQQGLKDGIQIAAQHGAMPGGPAPMPHPMAAPPPPGAGGPPGMGAPPMPPRPPMPGGPGMPPPGGMMARGGAMHHRDERGRFSGGAV